MIQFYLLSVVMNVAAGLVLIFTKEILEDAAQASAAGLSFLETKNFRLALGVLSAFVGIIKLLSVVQGDVPVLGDLVPAVAGIVGGACLLYEYYKVSSTVPVTMPSFFETLFVSGRKYVGIACVAVGTVHFILPRVLFL